MIPPQSAQFPWAQAKRNGQDEQCLQAAEAGPGAVEAELVAAGAAGDSVQVGADLRWGRTAAWLGVACGMGSGRAVLGDLYSGAVGGSSAASGGQHGGRLLLDHRAGRSAGLALGQVGEFGDVPADQVMPLRAADGPGARPGKGRGRG